MATLIRNTAGTVLLTNKSAVLEHIFANGTTYGKVDVYDATSATATLGTANLAWSNTFSANDVSTGKNINQRFSNGIVAVMASAQQTFFQWSDGSKRAR